MTKKISGHTTDELQELDPAFLMAIIREKAHHTVEFPLYQATYANQKVPRNLGDSLRDLLDIWEDRGLPRDRDDLKWCYALLEIVDQVKAGQKPETLGEPVAPFSNEEQQVAEKLIRTRRSIRVWQDTPVPRNLVEEVLAAGLWAPHACNLQTIRYIVIEGEEGKELFRSSEITGWPTCIIIAQDLRAYECFATTVPAYNRDLDCGAATQNILLRAHALGLGAVWGTFVSGEAEAIHKHFNLPEHIRLRTYVAMGWPAQLVLAPGRISVEEAILAWD